MNELTSLRIMSLEANQSAVVSSPVDDALEYIVLDQDVAALDVGQIQRHILDNRRQVTPPQYKIDLQYLQKVKALPFLDVIPPNPSLQNDKEVPLWPKLHDSVQASLPYPMEMKIKLADAFLQDHPLVFGFPTVQRSTDYIATTLQGMFSKVAPSLRRHLKIVVLNCNVPSSDHHSFQSLKTMFSEEVSSGQLILLELPGIYNQLQRPMLLNWNDETDRVRWRSKQVLDFAYLMEQSLALTKAEFYIQMEDDIQCSNHYLTEMAWWLQHYFYQRNDWFILTFYSENTMSDRSEYNFQSFYGFIGQLMRAEDLPELIKYLQTRFSQSPVDWLVKDFIRMKQQTFGSGYYKLYAHNPSIFQHVGKVSSLKKKNQNIQSQSFRDSADYLKQRLEPVVYDGSRETLAYQLASTLIQNASLVIGYQVCGSDDLSALSSHLSLLVSSVPEDFIPHVKIVIWSYSLNNTARKYNVSGHLRQKFIKEIEQMFIIIPEVESTDSLSLLEFVAQSFQKSHHFFLEVNQRVQVSKHFLIRLYYWLQLHYIYCDDWFSLDLIDEVFREERLFTQLDADEVEHGSVGQLFRISDLSRLIKLCPNFQTCASSIQADQFQQLIRSNQLQIQAHYPPLLSFKSNLMDTQLDQSYGQPTAEQPAPF
ncbi:hypothetical protein MIR68_011641 [Amoeboaphelidium protococcarum]|nr:hypothetical protein MIR68_011641 [Amoeboaphelidium protococcarum]